MIDQKVANRIAQTVPMQYPVMKSLFLLGEKQAEREELVLRNQVKKETGDDLVARAVRLVMRAFRSPRAHSPRQG